MIRTAARCGKWPPPECHDEQKHLWLLWLWPQMWCSDVQPLEKWSTMSRYVFFRPSKRSIPTLCQGRARREVCKSGSQWTILWRLHVWQCSTIWRICDEIPGHQTECCALAWHFVFPWCPSCIFVRISFCNVTEMISRSPFNRMSSGTVSSALIYDISSLLTVCFSGYPARQCSFTFLQVTSSAWTHIQRCAWKCVCCDWIFSWNMLDVKIKLKKAKAKSENPGWEFVQSSASQQWFERFMVRENRKMYLVDMTPVSHTSTSLLVLLFQSAHSASQYPWMFIPHLFVSLSEQFLQWGGEWNKLW